MTERRFFLNHNAGLTDIIDGDEFNHLHNVLRLKVGDDITVVCGDGFDYHYKITEISKKEAKIALKDKVKNNNDPVLKATLFLGIVKNDSFSSIVTKMSELGVSYIVPFNCERSGLKTADVKIDKMQKVANMAIKQCDMSTPLKVNKVVSFDEMIKLLNSFDEIYFAYENQRADDTKLAPKSKNIAVIVGPIGGFSEREATLICQNDKTNAVSLGRRIMRVETACTSLVSVLMYESGEWKIWFKHHTKSGVIFITKI